MTSDPTLGAVELFVLLVTAAAVVALVAHRLSLPYSVALVVLGLAVAVLEPSHAIEITPQLVLVVLVPGLVFEAAYRLDVVELRRTFLGVAILAVPGVVISAGTVAIVLSATGLPIQLAFIVGAITSATDPASVVSTFKALRAPRGLATLVEAESLFNDGTAIVVFSIALGGPHDADLAARGGRHVRGDRGHQHGRSAWPSASSRPGSCSWPATTSSS